MHKIHTFILIIFFVYASLLLIVYAEDTPQTATVNGIWQGSFDINGKGPFDFTAIHVDGQSTAVSHAAKTLCTGKVAANGDQYVAKYQMYALDGAPFDHATISGTLTNQQIDSQFVTEGAGDTGVLTLTYNPLYEQASSLDLVQGDWQFTDRDGLEVQWNIDQGVIQGKDSDQCEYTGVVELINPEYNAYLINLQIATCSSVNGEYRGLAYLDNTQDLILKTDIAGSFYGFHFDLQKTTDVAKKFL